MEKSLTLNLDFYLDAQGMMVFTEHFLLKRGYCCHSGCRHCPYQSTSTIIDPLIPIELQLSNLPAADGADWEEEE
jgi:hypothetical protein